jgi:hypothetical protein
MKEINQLLHGYDRGHRLLAGSVSLGPNADAALLSLTDLAGPVPPSGFTTYLTGYLVPDSEYFAVARTWLATEMKRPGSVWTHTLLLPKEVAEGIADARVLLQLFRRPMGPDPKLDQYRVKLRIPTTDDSAVPAQWPTGSASQTFIQELYSHPGTTAFHASTSEEFEGLILGAWSQLWPAARLSLSFSTGSLKLRSVKGSPLAVQVGPRLLLPDATFDVDLDNKPGLEALEQDLVRTGRTPLRDFLMRFGSGDDRTLAAKLATIHAWSKRPASVNRVADRVAELFPRADQGRRIKKELFGLDSAISSGTVVGSLVQSKKPAAFDPDQLQVGEHARRAWVSERPTVMRALRSKGARRDAIMRAALAGVASAATSSEIVQAWPDNPEVWIQVAELQPGLALDEAIWPLVTPDMRRRALRHAGSAASDKESRRRVGDFLIKRDPSELEGLDPEAMLPVADVLLQDPPQRGRRTDVWMAVLGDNQQVIGSWLTETKRSAGALARVSAIADPTHQPILVLGAKPWLPLVADLGQLENDPHLSIFLLTLGFGMRDQDAALLVGPTLGTAHDALRRRQETALEWARLSVLLPNVHWWETWDRGLRLRTAVADRVAAGDLPANVLEGMSGQIALVQDLVDLILERPSGRRALRAAHLPPGIRLD